MFNFLKSKKKDEGRDLEQVIYEIAEFRKEQDYLAFFKLIEEREIYFPVAPESLPSGFQSGQKIVTDASMQIRIKTVIGPSGGVFVPASTTETSKMVEGGYCGINWFSFLEMALKIEGAAGILIQGQKSWLAFDRERIKYLLENRKI